MTIKNFFRRNQKEMDHYFSIKLLSHEGGGLIYCSCPKCPGVFGKFLFTQNIFLKIFEEEMSRRIKPKTPLEIFGKFMLDADVIFISYTFPDDKMFRHVWVK